MIDNDRAWDWLPFPCAIPWREMVLTIPRNKYLIDPVGSIKDLISNVTEERLLRLQQLSMYHAADIDWTAHNSRVLENMLRESYHIPCRSFEENVCLSNSANKTRCTVKLGNKYETSRNISCN